MNPAQSSPQHRGPGREVKGRSGVAQARFIFLRSAWNRGCERSGVNRKEPFTGQGPWRLEGSQSLVDRQPGGQCDMESAFCVAIATIFDNFFP